MLSALSLNALSAAPLAMASANSINVGVNLPEPSGTRTLFSLVEATALEFPTVFDGVSLSTSTRTFDRNFDRDVLRIEDARVRSTPEQRLAISRFMTDWSQRKLVYRTEAHDIPLYEYMMVHAEPLETTSYTFDHAHQGLRPQVPYKGEVYSGDALDELIEGFRRDHRLTEPAQAAIEWIHGMAEQNGGRLDLRGQKFVMLGAGAELAPTELLLKAGADVLWIDRDPPSQTFLSDPNLSGNLYYTKEAADLLTLPREIAATIRKFAGDDSVHIGAFAYVGGRGREWRLTASMNAIIRSLPHEMLGSFSTFVSPTSPVVADDADRRHSIVQKGQLSRAKRHLIAPWFYRTNYPFQDSNVGNFLVPMQGASYLGAQWVEKTLAGEVFAAAGNTVSTNVAGISRTRSMQTLVFELGFLGAEPQFETYAPGFTRWANGMMMLHDILNPNADHVMRQIHGGIYAGPHALVTHSFGKKKYPITGAIAAAAIVGGGRKVLGAKFED